MQLPCAHERFLDRRCLTQHRLQEALRLGNELAGRLIGAERLDVARSLHQGVVGDSRHGRMPGAAPHGDLERRGHLLGRRAHVDRRAAEHEPVATTFVDRVGAADSLRMGAHQPAEAVPLVTAYAADLLVRDRHVQEIARGLEALPHEGGEGDCRGGGLVLHVERATAPHLVVDEIARPRIARPLTGIGEDGIGMREEHQRRPFATLEPRDDVRPIGVACVVGRLDSVSGEVVAKHVRGFDLVSGRIHRVDAEERLQQRRDFLAQGHSDEALEREVSSFRTSQSSGYDVLVTSRPRSSTGVPCVPTTLSPITRATTW